MLPLPPLDDPDSRSLKERGILGTLPRQTSVAEYGNLKREDHSAGLGVEAYEQILDLGLMTCLAHSNMGGILWPLRLGYTLG